MGIEGLKHADRLRWIAGNAGADSERRGQRLGVGAQRVRAQRVLGRLIDPCEQGARIVRPERRPPLLDDP